MKMRLPKNSELIDENTVAFYTFNGNYNDSCGRYNLDNQDGRAAYYIDNGVGSKAIYGISRLRNYSLNYIFKTTHTIDFVANIRKNGYRTPDRFGLYCGIFTAGDSSSGFQIYNNNIYYGSLQYDITNYMNYYHHYTVTKINNNVTLFIDGIKLTTGIVNTTGNYMYIYGSTVDNGYPNDFCYLYNLRFSNIIRWTEDFISPYDIKMLEKHIIENEDNIYGMI